VAARPNSIAPQCDLKNKLNSCRVAEVIREPFVVDLKIVAIQNRFRRDLSGTRGKRQKGSFARCQVGPSAS
jgi:hypothetical protein